MPVVEDVEQQEETGLVSAPIITQLGMTSSPPFGKYSQGNEAEGLDGQKQVVVAVAVALGGEDHCDEPEVREDEVEHQVEAEEGGQEECGEEKHDGEDGLDGGLLALRAGDGNGNRGRTMTSI